MAADAEVRLTVTGEDAGGTDVLEDVGDAARQAKKDVDRLGDSEGLVAAVRDNLDCREGSLNPEDDETVVVLEVIDQPEPA